MDVVGVAEAIEAVEEHVVFDILFGNPSVEMDEFGCLVPEILLDLDDLFRWWWLDR